MSKLDLKAEETVKKLQEKFQFFPNPQEDIICPYTVGIEIEIKFRYFFPEIFQKYFEEGSPFRDKSEIEQNQINSEIQVIEEPLLKKLEDTIECGVPKGNDKYWEFAFNPVNNLTLLHYQIEILKAVGLIPFGHHSLHMTVGTKCTNKMYWVLSALELLFLDKERIQSGFPVRNYSTAWAKKGRGGIFKKNQYDLIDTDCGFEFRTLMINPNSNVLELLKTFNRLLNSDKLLNDLKELMLSYGLPDENWETPTLRPDVWKLYIENFDELSNKFKSLYGESFHTK